MLCGWLSPNGDFYPCGPYEHVHLADKLTSSHYPNTEDTVNAACDDFLLAEKWIKLFCDGLVVGNILHPALFQKNSRFITEQQMNWIITQQHELSTKQERCLGMYLELEGN